MPAWIWNYEHRRIIHCCSVSCFLLACLSVMAAVGYQFCWECVWQQPDRFPLQERHEAGAAIAWTWAKHLSKLLQRFWWPRFILVILVSAHWKCFLAFRHAAGQSFPMGCEPQTFSVVIAELFCYSAMQKQQAFRLINKSSTHLWCEKWNIYACQSNVSVLQPHALLMPDGGWSKYQLV